LPTPRRRCPARGHVDGREQIVTRHHVRVDVVVGDRAVLIGAGDAVDVEEALGVVVAQRPPQPCGMRQQVHPRVPLELDVTGDVDIADHGGGDGRVDVEGGGAGRPVARALLTMDRPPREGRAREAELGRVVQGGRQRVPPPPQSAGDRIGRGEREYRQDEGLGIPERVPVVAGPGQALRRDRTALPADAGLQHVE